MPRKKNDHVQFTCRVPMEARQAIEEICKKQGWLYGPSLPYAGKLIEKIALYEEIEIGGKKFLLIPLTE